MRCYLLHADELDPWDSWGPWGAGGPWGPWEHLGPQGNYGLLGPFARLRQQRASGRLPEQNHEQALLCCCTTGTALVGLPRALCGYHRVPVWFPHVDRCAGHGAWSMGPGDSRNVRTNLVSLSRAAGEEKVSTEHPCSCCSGQTADVHAFLRAPALSPPAARYYRIGIHISNAYSARCHSSRPRGR